MDPFSDLAGGTAVAADDPFADLAPARRETYGPLVDDTLARNAPRPAPIGPRPKTGTVRVGPVQPASGRQGGGTTAAEYARLRTTGPLAQRIEFSLRSGRETEGNPAKGARLDTAMDRATPMSLGRGIFELATGGAAENVAATAGDTHAQTIIDKLARSGVDVSEHATALGLARAGGNFAGGLALSQVPGVKLEEVLGAVAPDLLAAAMRKEPRALALLSHAISGASANATIAGAGSVAEGDDLAHTLKNVGGAAEMGAGAGALLAPELRGILGDVGEAGAKMLTPSRSSSGRRLTDARVPAYRPVDRGPVPETAVEAPAVAAAPTEPNAYTAREAEPAATVADPFADLAKPAAPNAYTAREPEPADVPSAPTAAPVESHAPATSLPVEEPADELASSARAGAAHPAVVRTIAGAGVGGVAGSMVGDTPEERKRNAIIGMGLGATAAAGVPSLASKVLTPASRVVLRKVRDEFTKAFSDAYAPIREQAPALHAAFHASGAMPPISAARFVGAGAERALEHLTPRQREIFGRRVLLAQYDAEATRQAKAAEFARREGSSEPSAEDPKKSKRGLWYSQATVDGALRSPEEMETGPLLDEFARRIEASRKYHAVQNLKKDGLGLAQRNEERVWDIHKLLTTRDGLDSDAVWAEGERRAREQKTGEPQHEDNALEFDVHPPIEKPSETAIRANMMQQASDRFRNLASDLRQKLPANVHREPWFQQATDKVMMNVQGFNEAGARGAGVDPKAFRQPVFEPGMPAPYMRLMNETRYRDQLMKMAQVVEAGRPGATKPRTGLALKIFGQRPAAVRTVPAGAAEPLQGPIDTRRDVAAMGNLPRGTAITSTVQHATGEARRYVDDFVTTARADAADKVSKMQRNAVYREVAKIPDAELTPDRDAPPGKRVLVFNDIHELVPPPAPGDPVPKGFRRFAVTPEIFNAVESFHRRIGGQAGVPIPIRLAAGWVTRASLMNFAAAPGHALTLASSAGTQWPADAGFVRALVTGLPGVKMISTLRRIAKVDFSDPEDVATLQRLALSGALRISPDEQRGWMNGPHHILFGPTGVDPRARVVAAKDFRAMWQRAGGDVNDPAYLGAERDAIVGHAGNYVAQNSGTWQQGLQDSGIAPFIAINRAKYSTALRAIAGGTEGLPNPTPAQRAVVAARGPLGTAAALVGAGYLLSGHSAAQNAPGHETDVATGVYHLPDAKGNYHASDLSSYRYFRGSPDDAAQSLGPHAKEVYVRKSSLDPVSATALRLLEPLATAKPGDKVSELVRGAYNAVTSLAGPAPQLAFGALSGRSLYQDRDGALGTLQGIHLAKDAGLVDRLWAAGKNVNSAAGLALPGEGQPGRSVPSSVLGNLWPITEARAGTAPRDAQERRDEGAWQDNAVKQIFFERDAAKRTQLVETLLDEAKASGFNGPKLRATFTKAANRAAVDRSDAARQRFMNQIRGAAATRPPSAAPDPFADLGPRRQ